MIKFISAIMITHKLMPQKIMIPLFVFNKDTDKRNKTDIVWGTYKDRSRETNLLHSQFEEEPYETVVFVWLLASSIDRCGHVLCIHPCSEDIPEHQDDYLHLGLLEKKYMISNDNIQQLVSQALTPLSLAAETMRPKLMLNDIKCWL